DLSHMCQAVLDCWQMVIQWSDPLQGRMRDSMWKKIRDWFKDSETIFWARAQIFLGLLFEALAGMDVTLFEPVFGKYFPVFIVLNGLLTELLRRRRSDL